MIIKNISYSIFYKLVNALIMLALVPLLINILGVEKYGIWVAFTSLLVWISLFDFGIGYALQNTISRNLATNTMQEAKDETYQTLKMMSYFSIFLFIIFIISLFNFDTLEEHLYLSLYLFVPIIFFFPLTIGKMILIGARKIALQSGLGFLNTLLFFISILVVNVFKINISLITLAILFVSAHLVAIFLVWFFSMKIVDIKYKDYSQVFKQPVNFSRITVGLKFFGLQLSSLVLYSIGTILVFSYLNATSAAHFDIVNKIYIFGLSIFSIAITVFWPEIVKSIEKNEFLKVRRMYFIMLLLAIVFMLGSIAFSYFAPHIIELWTNNNIFIHQEEIIYFSFLVSTQAIAYCGAVVLNAYEKINIQLILSLISTIIMLPLSLFFIDNGYGITAIPISAGLLTVAPAIYCNIHAIKLINKGIKYV